jgi:hypothetical protein
MMNRQQIFAVALLLTISAGAALLTISGGCIGTSSATGARCSVAAAGRPDGQAPGAAAERRQVPHSIPK